jgi:rubredoxin
MVDWTCPNCGTANEFSVQHCAPDDIGAIYPVIECHICGLICSDERAEKIRANWPRPSQRDAKGEGDAKISSRKV